MKTAIQVNRLDMINSFELHFQSLHKVKNFFLFIFFFFKHLIVESQQ